MPTCVSLGMREEGGQTRQACSCESSQSDAFSFCVLNLNCPAGGLMQQGVSPMAAGCPAAEFPLPQVK